MPKPASTEVMRRLPPSGIDPEKVFKNYIFGNRYMNRGAAELVRRSQISNAWLCVNRETILDITELEFVCDLRILSHNGWLSEDTKGISVTEKFLLRCYEKAPLQNEVTQ